MNQRILVTLVSTLLLIGCQSTPKATGTANKLTEMSTQLREASTTMDTVVKTLNAVTKPGADMAKEYGLFEDAVDRMAGQASKIRTLRASVDTNKGEFLKTWEENSKTISDADLRKRADERRDEVVTKLETLGKQGETLRTAYDKWMADVTDVRTYLESDLNPAGVKSASDIIGRVNKGATSLEKDVQTLAGELDKISEAIAAAKPPTSS